MASLGELFIELGVVGDVKPLKDAVETMKENVALIDKQIKKNQQLLQYLQDLKNATSEAEKKLIKQNFAKQVQINKANKEIQATQKQIKGKELHAAAIAKNVKAIGLFIGGIIGAVAALNRLTNSLAESNQQWINLTRQTDISLQTFQKWGAVGDIVDKSLGAQGVAGTLENLNKKLFEMRLTGEGARGFILAGINPNQDAEGVLNQLRERISGMNNTQASWLLEQMGIDPRMITILRMSKDEFNELTEATRKYQLTAEQRQSIDQMNRQLRLSQMQLQYLKDRAVLAIMPAFTKFMQSIARIAEFLARGINALGKFINKHRILTASMVIGLTKIKPLVAFFQNLLKTFGALIRAIPILGKLFGALGGWIARALLPLTALFLFLDDLAVYQSGSGKSLIGEGLDFLSNLWNSDDNFFGKIVTLLEGVVEFLARIVDAFLGTNLAQLWLNFLKKDEEKNDETNEIIDNAIKQGIYSSPAIGTEDYDRMFSTPAMVNNANRTTNDNRQTNINQTNNITTTQPANTINNELQYATVAYAG